MDADVIDIPNKYMVRDTIDEMDNSSFHKVLVLKQGIIDSINTFNDVFLLFRISVEIFLKMRSLLECNTKEDIFFFNQNCTRGHTTVIDLKTFCETGGYNMGEIFKFGEDKRIGEALSLVYSSYNDRQEIVPEKRIVGSSRQIITNNPRRWIQKLMLGSRQPDFTDGDNNRVLREISIANLNNEIGQYITEENKHLLEYQFSIFRRKFDGLGDSEFLFQRFMFFLGFHSNDFSVSFDSTTKKYILKIKSLENINNILGKYRERAFQMKQHQIQVA